MEAAFDAMEHKILKKVAKRELVRSLTLAWFESYHSERTQRVSIDNSAYESSLSAYSDSFQVV